jgi:alpha-glucosidase
MLLDNIFNPPASRPQEFYPNEIVSVQRDGDTISFKTENGVMLALSVETDHILRFRYATEGFFQEDFSYAIYKDYESSYQTLTLEEKEDCWSLSTAVLKVCVKKRNMKVVITDAKSGVEINRDEKGFHWEGHPHYGGNIVMMSKVVQGGEHYYGLGDKATQMNLRGKRVQLWGTDEYGFGKEKDPLYKSIPFFTAIANNLSYGIFFDNSFKSYFDFASERNTACSFWAHGGEMNYYFIYGPTPIEVTERYANLTGKPELPPLWALGFHQCKWSYYPEQVVRDICAEFRKRRIPCDAIYLDIDYMDGFRCFTWDKEKFPDPKKMVSELEADGFKTVVIIDPGIKIDPKYKVFQEGFEKGFFCKRADGDYMKGKVWPGECYFVDFTNPEARAWWADQFKELISETGVRGVWNDMNEPAVFEVEGKTFPSDVRHDYDGHPCSHRKAHNVYGMQMARATYHGVKNHGRPNRPFVITRSLYSGTQRYSATWSGDNIANWEHLWLANVMCQRMAISGHSFIGSDIGGFTEHPTSELFVRWIQLGVFHPMMRVHSSGDHGAQEPWTFNEEAEAIVKKFIEIRYRLLPYLYTTFWQNSSAGTPMMRPISFTDFTDQSTLYRNEEFLYGDHLLVCPVSEPGTSFKFLYFPKGDWYDYFSHKKLKGGRERQVKTTLETMPLYVRAGAVLPEYPVMQYVGEFEIKELRLKVFHSQQKVSSVLYEDAGDGYEYKKGSSNVKNFTQVGNGKELKLRQHTSGRYQPSYKVYNIELIGLPFVPSKIVVDDIESEVSFQVEDRGVYSVKVPAAFEEIRFLS